MALRSQSTAIFSAAWSSRIGDVRDYDAVAQVVTDADIVIHAAALKQVPTCEYFPQEAVRTNIDGAANVVRAIRQHGRSVTKAVAVSTDKACKPVNVMGMTKAIQERIFIEANLGCARTAFLAVRYGNVVASRGSVVPLFKSQIRAGGPVTITTPEMTRFLISLDDAVSTIFAALADGGPGETYVPRIPSARMIDLAKVMIGDRPIELREVGIRPGEKVHEILISEEEMHRTVERGDVLCGSAHAAGIGEWRESAPRAAPRVLVRACHRMCRGSRLLVADRGHESLRPGE